MGLSVKPTIRCNLSCTYCYESNIRNAGNAIAANEYDYEALYNNSKEQIINTGLQLTVHGGEPLLMKKEHLEELFKLSFEHTGGGSIQTNAELVDDDHIRMFKEYNVQVGVSYDGHGRLALGRWKGSEAATLKAAEKIWNNIVKMRKSGVRIGVIAIITRKNGLPEFREEFKQYILDLKNIGITGGRLNPVQVDFQELIEEFELTIPELTEFYLDMADFTTKNGLHWTPFRDTIDALLNLNLGTCIYTRCDWYHTLGEQAILPDGEIGTCLKTAAKDGVMFLRDEYGTSNERYQVLRAIPQSEGGCGGCRYWNICGGICPGEGAGEHGADWRGKSKYCHTFYALYEHYENQLRALMPNAILSTDIKEEGPIHYNNGHITFKKMLNTEYNNPSSWKMPKPKEKITVTKVEVR